MHHPVTHRIRRTLAGVAFFAAVATAASAQGDPDIQVSPSHPTTADIVHFTISGTWANGCVPEFHSGTIRNPTRSEARLRVNRVVEMQLVSKSGACTQVTTPYEVKVRTNSPLSAGTYLAFASIDDGRFVNRRKFVVLEAQHHQDTVAFRTSRVSVHENDHTAMVYVERTGSGNGAVSVDYVTADGTAQAGADFDHTQGTLTWHDGDRSPKAVSVRLFDDFELEGDEVFRLELRHATGATLGHPQVAEITITDDESASSGACHAGPQTLCLQEGRFEVRARWRTPQGKSGTGNPGAFTDETGYFWFFSNENVEVLVKVLDGCSINDTYWVYVAGLTNVWVDLEIRDTATGEVKNWINPMGQSFRPIEDTGFFDCHR